MCLITVCFPVPQGMLCNVVLYPSKIQRSLNFVKLLAQRIFVPIIVFSMLNDTLCILIPDDYAYVKRGQ